MLVDAKTLADLEIFRDSSGKGGILALVDSTWTAPGRKALQRRFKTPHTTTAATRRTQDSVRFLMENQDFALPAVGSTEQVVRYLESNIEIARAETTVTRAVEAAWLGIRYRELIRDLREGISVTTAWLRSSHTGARSLLAGDPPEELRTLANTIRTAAETIPLSESRSVMSVLRTDRLLRRRMREELQSVVRCVAELDALSSMARATKRLGWSLPEILESDRFRIEGDGLYHPFVPTPIPNRLVLSDDEPMMFLTGPNMAGKTTYLRAAALAVLLAQVGMGVPAESMKLTPVEVLLTSLNPADNLREGVSYFLSEVSRVREAATHLAEGRRSFVLFDEVFKGTNVKDALDASATVILGFAKARDSGFIFSSHLVELVEQLRESRRVGFHHFDGTLEQGKARYSYRVKPGVSRQRLGMQLLTEAEIPALLERIGNHTPGSS